ncbi:uncharacterized protein LOC115281125 isoform X2 [Suricata suricatta]|uniref:uncharacterized protein LOC115281125 isoform X2 n=1 Tax=Suricata suricatta TaxID=37032 RepID=UPI0011557B55|nr:uncharacterized protein LOC115281125 isoform X2 [Suricata suricatta]
MQVRLAPVSSGSGQLGSLTVTPKPEGHTPFAKTVFRPPSQPLLSDPETPPPPNRAPPTRLPPIAPEDTRPGPKAGKGTLHRRICHRRSEMETHRMKMVTRQKNIVTREDTKYRLVCD